MDIVDIQNEHIDISPFRYLYKSMDIHTRVTLPDVARGQGTLPVYIDSENYCKRIVMHLYVLNPKKCME